MRTIERCWNTMSYRPLFYSQDEIFMQDLHALFNKFAFQPDEHAYLRIFSKDMNHSIMRHSIDSEQKIYAFHVKGKSDSTIQIPDIRENKYTNLSDLDTVIELCWIRKRVHCNVLDNVRYVLNGCKVKDLKITQQFKNNPPDCHITVNIISQLMAGTHPHLQLADGKTFSKESSWKKKGLFALATVACACALAYFKGLIR